MVRLYLFGGLRVEVEGRTELRFRTARTASLLAYLAYHPDKPHSREYLAELLWPESAPDSARHSLRVALSSLRKLLESPGRRVFLGDRQTLYLDRANTWVDVAAWRSLLEWPDAATRADALAEAAALYTGPLLAGLYDDWVVAAQEEAAARQDAAMRELVRLSIASGKIDLAVPFARRRYEEDPLCEDACAELMHVLALLGRIEEAEEVYQRCVAQLKSALDRQPSPALQRSMELVASRRTALERLSPTAAGTGSLSLLERSGPMTGRPSYGTSFLGRTEELEAVRQWWRDAESRLLTLCGIGGIGKSRLAARFLEELGGSEGANVRLLYVGCSGVSDAHTLPGLMLDRLSECRPVALDIMVALRRALSARPTLIVLDDFEQLMPSGANIVWTLLQEVRSVRFIVSSRRRLSLPAERVLMLGPLATPENTADAHLDACAAFRLFCDRANQARPGIKLTRLQRKASAELCIRAEGIPLMLEVLAARCSAMSPQEICSDFTGYLRMPPAQAQSEWRHDTLAQSLLWSLNLLPASLARAWTHLAALPSHWSLNTAAGILPDLTRADLLEVHAQLQAHSLIQPHAEVAELRFKMLDPLRQFAVGQLPNEVRDQLYDRLLDWSLDYCRDLPQRLDGAEGLELLWRLEREYPNIRAMLVYGLKNCPDRAALLACSLWKYWWRRGHLGDGIALTREALASPCVSEAVRGRLLFTLGILAFRAGDYATAVPALEESRGLCQSSEDAIGSAYAGVTQAILAVFRGSYPQSLALAEDAGRLFLTLGDEWGQAAALDIQCLALGCLRRFTEAERCGERAYTLFTSIGDVFGCGSSAGNQALLLLAQERYAEAEWRCQSAQEYLRACGCEYGWRISVGFGAIARHAAGLLKQDNLDECVLALEEAVEGADPTAKVFILESIAYLLGAFGEAPGSLQLLRAADSVRDSNEMPRLPLLTPILERIASRCRESIQDDVPLPETPLMSTDQALSLGLAELRALAAGARTAPAATGLACRPDWQA
ncbi:MAG: AfsR/SARP family transcriptional regulator [Armatimonadota bacterium]